MFILQKLVARNKVRQNLLKSFEETDDKRNRPIINPPSTSDSPKRKRDLVNCHSRWQVKEKFQRPCPLHPLLSQLSDQEFKGLWTTFVYLKGKCGLRRVAMLMVRVFDKMEKRKPAIREIFVKAVFMHATKNEECSIGATLFDHGKLLATLLDMIICGHSHQHGETLGLNTIGCKHTSLVNIGLNAEMWEIFGQCFSEIMILEDCVRAFPHASRAWNKLIAGLTDRLRASFEQQLKKLKRKTIYSSAPSVMVPHSATENKSVDHSKLSKGRPNTEPLRRRTIIEPTIGQILVPISSRASPSIRHLPTSSDMQESINSGKVNDQPRLLKERPKTEPLRRGTIIGPALFPGQFLLPIGNSIHRVTEVKHHVHLRPYPRVQQSINCGPLNTSSTISSIYRNHHFRRNALF